ncbi:hypothetical protein K488DRAFT_60220 [Vararia minispora EC-137]|uniref:Uncharacterized protein n=1 Tax=Vararia minispora EC-137 TaxID=1314806 RepID=A0ACB8Q8N8_9AGAM|nr:hypothetical protein K488DRAFT_60220 [Vararia minispora EC-137]
MPRTFAYYCSGHGYGHATRVSAFASHLLLLEDPPTIHIVSSAPAHVFQDSIALGAHYRNALIDPVVVQPVAYRVDREKSVAALKSFLKTKEEMAREEADWLKTVGADCVLSDAAFLAFIAADRAQIPSVLVTNFTFDSVFSYLSHPVNQASPHLSDRTFLSDNVDGGDSPVPEEVLEPLVRQVYDGYRRADLLLRLPGYIPIPSFSMKPALPAPRWIDPWTGTFDAKVVSQLYEKVENIPVHPSLPFSASLERPGPSKKPLPRTVRPAPLLVRLPSADVYTSAGRARVLSALGVPSERHDVHTTRILVVSFGGQVFHVPRSRTPSRPNSFISSPASSTEGSPPAPNSQGLGFSFFGSLQHSLNALADREPQPCKRFVPPLFSTSHIHIPGAPAPASLPASPISPRANAFEPLSSGRVVVRSPSDESLEDEPHMLPDESWIAIVCGVDNQAEGELPDGFYVAPKDVYMPDLMAVADVLLGKLGFGTVAECVDSCTPFVYISRPLFVEEHGLKIYLDRAGVGVEMAHNEYESGHWAARIADAWARGGTRKCMRREGAHAVDRRAEGRDIAEFLMDWVEEWKTSAEE